MVTKEEVMNSKGWTLYQYGIVAMLLLAQTTNYICRVNLSVVNPTLMKLYGFGPAKAGLLLSLFNWSMVFSMLFTGPLADRFHSRRVLPAGVTIWSLATLLSAISVPFLSFTRVLLGVGAASCVPSASRLVAEIFKKEDQGKAIGIYFSGTKIGVTLGISLSAAILAAYGWRAVFVVTGLLSLLWLVPWFLIYRPGKGVLKETIAAPGAAQTAERIKWRSLFAYREVWALMLGQGGYLYVYFVFLTWLPSYLILERKMSILKTGILGMFPFLIAIFVGIFSGWLGDRWLKAGGQLSVVRKTFIGGGFALSTTFILIAINVRSTVPALFCLFMSMGILGMVSPNINALPIDLAPRRIVSTVAALQNVGGNVGGALAPMVTGLLYGMTGNFKVALLATAGVALVFGTFVHIFMLGKIEPCIGIKKQSAAAS